MRRCYCIVLVVATVVWGQDLKPDPPREKPKPHPDAKYVVTEDLMNMFLRDFEAQGSPRVVIVGSAVKARGIDNEALAREVGRIFACDGQIDIIAPSALDAAIGREIRIFQTKNHPHARELAKLKVHADLAIRIRCARHEARPDRPWLVSVSVVSLGDGRELSYVPQPMPPVWSVTTINKFTHYFVSKTFRNLLRRWTRRGMATDVLVTFVNMTSHKHVREAKARMKALKGVSRVRLDSSTDVGNSKTTLFRVRYDGATDDFYLELLAALEDFPVKVKGTDLRPNAVVLTARDQTAAARKERRRKLLGAALKRAYRSAGRPRVVVMVNSETEMASDDSGRTGLVVERPAPVDVDTRGEGSFDRARWDREIGRRKRYAHSLLEDALYKQLLKLKIKCVDGRTPRLAMLGTRTSVTTTEGKAVRFLRDRKLADVLFSGVGHHTAPPGGPNGRGLVKYTFRAVRVSDDLVLGTGSVTWSYDQLKAYYSGETEGGLPQATKTAAERVLEELFESIVPAWASPTDVRVTVDNAPDDSSVRALAKFIEQNSDRVSSVFGHQFIDHGNNKTSAELVFEVDGGADGLAKAIRDLSEDAERKLPYQVKVTHKSANRLTLQWIGRQ